MKRLIIIGAGGHGKVIADIALKNGYTDIFFADDNSTGDCVGFPIICTSKELEKENDGETEFVIAIGNNNIRKKIGMAHSLDYATLVHPSASVGINVKLGTGTVVMAGAVINACTVIGDHCIVNSNAVVEHDNVLEDYVHISPNAALGGMVCVGACTHVGIGASVKNNVKICPDSVIGAGATVVKDINFSGTYIGVPAERMSDKI